jgi:hypothetical protein
MVERFKRLIDTLKSVWRDRFYCRMPILEHDRALIAAIGTARAEAYTETRKIRMECAQRQAYPVELVFDAVTVRAQRHPKGPCKKCHGRGNIGMAHIRVRDKQVVHQRSVVICGCVGAWVQVQSTPKVQHA